MDSGQFCAMGMSKDNEREYAELLYTKENLTAKEIASRCNVSEKTVGNWILKYNWKNKKRSLIIVKDNQIASLYEKLEMLNLHIETTTGNIVTSKDVDAISKLTSSIKSLEVETSLGETIDVAKKFIDFVREFDLDFAKKATQYFDMFIQTKLK